MDTYTIMFVQPVEREARGTRGGQPSRDRKNNCGVSLATLQLEEVACGLVRSSTLAFQVFQVPGRPLPGELARQPCSPGATPRDTTLALSPDYETSSSLIGGVHSLLESAGGSCRDIKRAESAERGVDCMSRMTRRASCVARLSAAKCRPVVTFRPMDPCGEGVPAFGALPSASWVFGSLPGVMVWSRREGCGLARRSRSPYFYS